ncbi:hypothetical protein D5R81_15700 [Parashewanella spongiae]|uniref:DNA polymerase III subunit psi n=2 Tax=Parashewanella spongiae TaxID=342950 RepID=A0A3A6U302_9GAMM|nr:hypothetical protein D5R81_15700 [Parashewanella spongiae]
MGIQQWVPAQEVNSQPRYLILHDDDDMPVSEQFIHHILSLLNHSELSFSFSEKPIKGAEIVWDMRSRKTRPHQAWIESEPMSKLLSNGEYKKQLWHQICLYLEKKSKIKS